jgi:hypothetical protein
MDSQEPKVDSIENNNSIPEVTGNGTLKRKRESDNSDDEKDFLGFDVGMYNFMPRFIFLDLKVNFSSF